MSVAVRVATVLAVGVLILTVFWASGFPNTIPEIVAYRDSRTAAQTALAATSVSFDESGSQGSAEIAEGYVNDPSVMQVKVVNTVVNMRAGWYEASRLKDSCWVATWAPGTTKLTLREARGASESTCTNVDLLSAGYVPRLRGQ